MSTISSDLVERVCAELPGSKKKRLQDGLAVLHASLEQGSWTPRGSTKVSAATSQGLCRVRRQYVYLNREEASAEVLRARDVLDGVEWALQYGQLRNPVVMGAVTLQEIQQALDTLNDCEKEKWLKVGRKLVTAELTFSWIRLLYAIALAVRELDRARPVPAVTAINLSPRVTATLTECGLDLDLSSIKPAKIDFYKRFLFNEDGSPKLDRFGEHDFEKVYFVAWSEGIAHQRSRFNWNQGKGQYLQCHACGKGIPSCMFVPFEAWDKKSQLKISMWLGTDCATNMFGIKDVGIEVKEAK